MKGSACSGMWCGKTCGCCCWAPGGWGSQWCKVKWVSNAGAVKSENWTWGMQGQIQSMQGLQGQMQGLGGQMQGLGVQGGLGGQGLGGLGGPGQLGSVRQYSAGQQPPLPPTPDQRARWFFYYPLFMSEEVIMIMIMIILKGHPRLPLWWGAEAEFQRGQPDRYIFNRYYSNQWCWYYYYYYDIGIGILSSLGHPDRWCYHCGVNVL